MITFASSTDFPAGTISKLLRECYASVQADKNIDWKEFAKVFDDFDKEIHTDKRVANCTFITTLDGKPIGLGSFDPRQKPAYGDIGHNCILPEFQGQGFGKQQIQEILRRLRERGIAKARVSTGTGSFGSPARKMYESCGFTKTRIFPGDYGEDMVEYEMQLS